MHRRRVPKRTCVACRQVKPKKELIRIVRSPSGEIAVDETGKESGRGAYLCPNRGCWDVALTSQRLEHAMRIEIRAEEKEVLRQHSHSLPTTPA